MIVSIYYDYQKVISNELKKSTNDHKLIMRYLEEIFLLQHTDRTLTG